MMPRKQLDLGWADLAAGLRACLFPRASARRAADPALLTRRPESVVCLSVRSGLDLLLTELAWPAGTEVLVSAITIPDISRILRQHGLVPVPVDLDPETLEVPDDAWEKAWTPRVRAVLVAHLFGGRLDLGGLLAWADRRGVQVWEDCAQAFVGDGWAGHEASDVRMFSFGPIKTATALGGGVLLVNHGALKARLDARHAAWPRQREGAYLRRLLKYSAIKLLLTAPGYTLWVAVLRLLGRDHDHVVTTSGRGFAGGDFFAKIRNRPSRALVALLERRLRQYDPRRVTERREAGAWFLARLRAVRPLGAAMPGITYWMFPARVADREKLLPALWARGIDATCGASSLHALPAPPDRPEPVAAKAAMSQVVYLPVYPAMGARRLERMAGDVNALARPPA